MKDKLLNRFLRYIAIDTQSDPNSETIPSVATQLVFAQQLVKELKGIGIEEVSLDRYGYVMAKIPANTKKKVPAIGFIAHIDTSPSMDGECVNPKLIENYDGKSIVINSDRNIVLDTKIFPELLSYKGQTLIHTDGTTLLGADDKAGIAEIMTAMEYILQHPEIEHGLICIAFTPDEEIGTGIDNFDVQKFGADYAYTIDGGGVGELEYENFNAAVVDIDIQGLDIHPGTAKGKMINSQLIAMEIENLLPPRQKPEYTDGYEGFFLLTHLNGSIEHTRMQYIIRDHDREKFEEKKQLLFSVIDKLNEKYGQHLITYTSRDQYYNMREKVEEVKFIVTVAEQAMKEAGIMPVIIPIRGGTDGSRLSFMGLPCPNIFTGGHNFHGKYEYVVLESMEKAVNTIINILKRYGENE
ncbi:MAG: peptidase T [Bacteroidales bacterium]|jgi:tripeptide aminopeptidase|nr:peptidase T [Bacteroidales bacterium]